ncbi:MAG TPA: GNAT family N-acetyltransferase [Solirubrobacteraceae bacterium]
MADAPPRRLRMLARLADVPPPPGPVASRPVRAGDGTALGLLAYAAYRGSVDDNGEHEAWHVADLTSALEDEYGRLLTPVSRAVPAADALIAAAVFTWWDDLPLLAFCLTHPDHQGRGLATRLVTHAARELAAEGHEAMHLAVTETNPARALYERLGFRETPLPTP